MDAAAQSVFISVILLHVAGCHTPAAPAPTYNTLKEGRIIASEIVLVNDAGSERARLRLEAQTSAPVLEFLDESGEVVASMTTAATGASLSLRDLKRKSTLKLTGSNVSILDAEGLALVRLMLESEGNLCASSLTVQSRGGSPLITLTTVEGGEPAAMIVGQDGKGFGSLVIENGEPQLDLKNQAGESLMALPR
jgi:hypothetical protein